LLRIIRASRTPRSSHFYVSREPVLLPLEFSRIALLKRRPWYMKITGFSEFLDGAAHILPSDSVFLPPTPWQPALDWFLSCFCPPTGLPWQPFNEKAVWDRLSPSRRPGFFLFLHPFPKEVFPPVRNPPLPLPVCLPPFCGPKPALCPLSSSLLPTLAISLPHGVIFFFLPFFLPLFPTSCTANGLGGYPPLPSPFLTSFSF